MGRAGKSDAVMTDWNGSMRDLLEACQWAKIPYPVSEDDLRQTVIKLHRLDIRHNLEAEPMCREILTTERRRVHEVAQAAIRKAQEGCHA